MRIEQAKIVIHRSSADIIAMQDAARTRGVKRYHMAQDNYWLQVKNGQISENPAIEPDPRIFRDREYASLRDEGLPSFLRSMRQEVEYQKAILALSNRRERGKKGYPIDPELVRTLAAVNHPSKVLLLSQLYLNPEGDKQNNLVNTSIKLASEVKVDVRPSSLRSYIAKLERANMISYDNDNVVLTDSGKKAAEFVGKLIVFSHVYNVPLINILGRARTEQAINGTGQQDRGTATRLRILFAILDSNNLYVSEDYIYKKLGDVTKTGIQHHLTDLNSKGILKFDSFRMQHQGRKVYLNQKDYDFHKFPCPNEGKLARKVAEIAASGNLQYITSETIYNELIKDQDYSTQGERLLKRIQTVAGFLQTIGVLSSEQFDKGEPTRVSLTKNQKNLLADFLETLDQFATPTDSDKKPDTDLVEVFTNTQVKKDYLQREYLASDTTTRRQAGDLKIVIEDILNSHPEGIKITELHAWTIALGFNRGTDSLTDFVYELRLQGKANVVNNTFYPVGQ